MKERKGVVRWVAIAAVLVILILMLTMCTRSCASTPEETLPTPAAETVAAVQPEQTEQTKPETQETTAPTEETTEPTEEAMEATTAPTTGSDDSSDEKEEDFGEEEPYWEGPDPGTPENPYVEVRDGYPAEVTSVNIPMDQEVSYLISGSAGSVITIQDPDVTLTLNGETYKADETTGELKVDLSKLAVDPVIHLSHSGKTAASCVLTLSEGMGGVGNPEPLTEPAELEVQLPEGDADGYHYRWTADITGRVELTLKEKEEVPEETQETSEEETEEDPSTEDTVPAEDPVLEIIVTIGEQVIKLSECEDGKLSFDAVKGQNVQIQVIAQPFSDGTYPEIQETILWNLLPNQGTGDNPEPIESIDTIPVALEAGDTEGYHYLWTAGTYGNVTLSAGELKLTVTVGETVYESTDGTVTFHVDKDQLVLIHAAAEAEAEEAVSATIVGVMEPDAGTPENPITLETIETVTVALAEGDIDGYSCQWTAQYSGTLILTAETAETEYDLLITNPSGSNVLALSESESSTLTLELEAGDTVTIQTIAVPDENGVCSAVNAVLKGEFTAAPGTSPESPIVIAEDQTAVTFPVEAKQTLYFSGMVHEMVATVENASGVTIHCGEKTVWASQAGVAKMAFPAVETEAPVEFSVTSKNEKNLTLTFAYPAGHEKNPAPLMLGTAAVELEENDADGYFFDWTAECDGQLTVSVAGKTGWQYQVDNLSTNSSGQCYTSTQEPITSSQTLDVKAGEKIRLTLWTLAVGEEETLPAGTLSVTASFFDPLLGTETKPIALNIETENSVTIPAGETLYYSATAEGMTLHFTGRDVALIHNGTEHQPENGKLEIVCHGQQSVFVIANPSEKDQTCRLGFTYPEGHFLNPAPLKLGEMTVMPGKTGQYFHWTAEADGVFLLTMNSESGWKYMITNVTAAKSGEQHSADAQEPVFAEEVFVQKGEQLRIMVNGDEETIGTALTCTTSFVPTEAEDLPTE